jgi:hypothetical protein
MTADLNAAAHEAGHAAGLIWSGRVPLAAAIGPGAGLDNAGDVTPDLGDDGLTKTMGVDLVLTILLGPLCEITDRGPWPPAFHALDGRAAHRAWSADQSKLALLVGWLKLDASDYAALVAIAEHLTADPEFKSLHAVIAAGLSRVSKLSGDDLRFLIGPKRVATYLEEGT